jgi:hypothetical protein
MIASKVLHPRTWRPCSGKKLIRRVEPHAQPQAEQKMYVWKEPRAVQLGEALESKGLNVGMNYLPKYKILRKKSMFKSVLKNHYLESYKTKTDCSHARCIDIHHCNHVSKWLEVMPPHTLI